MIQKIFSFIKKCIFYFLVISLGLTILFRFVPVPFTYLMLQRSVEQKMNKKELCFKKDWVPIEKISKNMLNAVIASEDQRFQIHWGFDWEAMQKAYEHNQTSNRTRGGSTITQQVAKNVFLWPQRSYVRKAFEAYFTILIEVCWSKERILEVYLNVVEMGDGIYGVEAASQHYFSKPASELSKSQAALLAAVLPNPLRWSVTKPNAYVQKRQARILNAMRWVEFKY